MKARLIRQCFIVAGVVIPGGLSLWWLSWQVADKPPSDAIENARSAIAAAWTADAPSLVPEAYSRCESSWTEMMFSLTKEGRRWHFIRDYSAVETLAHQIREQAGAAERKAHVTRDSLEWVVLVKMDAIEDHLPTIVEALKNMPFDAPARRALSRVRTLLVTIEGALRRGDVLAAIDQANMAGDALGELGVGVNGILHAYLTDLPRWQEWFAATVAESDRKGVPAIVIDKLAHRLYLYIDGALHASWETELGPKWMGPKRFEGDLSTPEGQYSVIRRRSGAETIYSRALEINYPNESDRARFLADKRAGRLPVDASIGGLIEIHGSGGRGTNWTRGCIALTDGDMAELFDKVPEGTPVTIVGALEPPAFFHTLNGFPNEGFRAETDPLSPTDDH